MARSTFYHTQADAHDTDLQAALIALVWYYPTYGYHRLTALLRRQAWRVNPKRDYAFPHYPNRVKAEQARHPDAIWVADVTYIRLERDFVYLAVIMDMFTPAVEAGI